MDFEEKENKPAIYYIGIRNGRYGFRAVGIENINEYEELIKMFLRPSMFEIVAENADISNVAKRSTSNAAVRNDSEDRDTIKKTLYIILSEITGKHLEWGVLTGVKPLKKFDILAGSTGEIDAARRGLSADYFVTDEKIDLLETIHLVQKRSVAAPTEGCVSIYIGIPFCPTRCRYCSFTSNVADEATMDRYLKALLQEIDYVSEKMEQLSLCAESLYIGGGTPTALHDGAFAKLLKTVNRRIPKRKDATQFEFTVEAGRPDTISHEKCRTMRENGVGRISINAQSMNEETLTRIGRNHDKESVVAAFRIAREYGFEAINTDVIAGLPGEDKAAFDRTLDAILNLEPENVTVHTLAIKRSSALLEEDVEYSYNNAGEAAEMLRDLPRRMKDKGYDPYYIYRQKRMIDNLENVGYAKPSMECNYNIRIMEEKQTVIAMGAGGSTKVYFPEENRIERVYNVANYEQYIDRIDEMIERKEKGLFTQKNGGNKC
jgi:oxygen-independent coproporphyrinogen-3 oxidase